MALYQEFTFKSNGAALASMGDFDSSIIGTQFEKNTGELYSKTSSGIFEKVNRKYYSQTESDARFLNNTGDNTLSGDFTPTSDNARNMGTAGLRFANMYSVYFRGTATTALYADLAEKYETDQEYPVGTVLEIGGEKEATLYQGGALAGVISENPAYMMNSEGKGQYIALKGKIPVICNGSVFKGQYCLATNGGKVIGVDKDDINDAELLDIVGVALEDSKDNLVMVKV